MPSSAKVFVSLFVSAVLLVSSTGCSSPPEEPLFSVSGLVKVDGVPAEGATIRFHPLGNPSKFDQPYLAQVDSAGNFTTSVRPPGEYAVTVIWPQVLTNKPGEERIEGEDRFKGKYDRVDTPAAKVNITAGENKLPPIYLKRR